MFEVLVIIICALVGAVLFLNLYFRLKVFKSYQYLVRNRISFSPKVIMNQKLLDDDVLPRYPKHASEIQKFCNHIRYSVKIASVLIILITILGGVLMYYRNQ